MTTIVFPNQSGGAGKTTTVTSVATNAVTKHRRKVRVIDGDLQCDSSHIFSYTDPDELEVANLFDVLSGDTTLAEATIPARFKSGKDDEGNTLWQEIAGLTIVLGSIELATADRNLAGQVGGEARLQSALDRDDDDEVLNLVDCPASLGLVTINALAAADKIIPCVKPGLKEVRALTRLEDTIDLVNQHLRHGRPKLKIDAVMVADAPASGKVYEDGVELVQQMYGDIVLPRVARSVRVPESYAKQKALPLYAPTSEPALNYAEVTAELVKRGIL